MNKKISIFAIILLLVGIVGTVGSTISAMPYFINTASNIEEEMNKENIIYDKDIKSNKLSIETDYSNILIKKSINENFKIAFKGSEEFVRYDVNDENNQLSLKEIDKNRNIDYNIKNLNELFDIGMKSLFSDNVQAIVVYVPNDVDIDVITKGGRLFVGDDVFLDNLTFKTSYGSISLPTEVKELNNLVIKSSNDITLQMSELAGIKNVDIYASSISISSSEKDIFIDDIEKYIPENIKVNCKNDINIYTDIPIAKNIEVSGEEATANIDLPISKYKINFDLSALENITIYSEELKNREIIDTTDNSRASDLKQVRGNLNKDVDSLENEYKVTMKCRYINVN